ncbi:hypothetical protein HGRIS_003265 [Hohenbuehelia grisea]|uniref:Dynamin N-terminal domain-containing protein n=1 Tax=Hohenbuehelia grisea TaxID=104357 RepID=A0ABR3JPF5_9AGAR
MDLPGEYFVVKTRSTTKNYCIGIVHHGDPSHVNLIKQLVETHIRSLNCFIVISIPMTDHIENQEAIDLARDVDPQGERTIGVLTKPDMLTSGNIGALKIYLEVIQGHRYHLGHGFYCLRLPNDAERMNHISIEDARNAESLFFKHTSPWASCTRKEQLGIESFASSLARLLGDLIARR